MTHPVDKYVGQRVRAQRRLMGLTQQQLASSIGIKFQQVQKYETGMNRISASKLWEISKTLQVEIEYFFEGYNNLEEGRSANLLKSEVENRDMNKLAKVYRKLPEAQRIKLFQLAQTLME